MKIADIEFPEYTGLRCLMMPYIQGDPLSVPEQYRTYLDIIETVFIKKGDIGYLTIDESPVLKGSPHRGYRAKTNRALHTEAGRDPNKIYCWGDGGRWNKSKTILDRDVKVLLANNIDNTCAIWDDVFENTSDDGDIGFASDLYPYADAVFMQAGEVYEIGILTPHESVPVKENGNRQFMRIVSSGVHGREEYFTENPVMK